MSLHVTNAEAEALIRRQRKISVMTSWVISLLTVFLILLVFSLFMLAPMTKEVPVIVTYETSKVEEPTNEQQKKTITKETKPAAPSPTRVNVIVAQTVSPTMVPTEDVDISTPALDFGSGDDFGDGWGAPEDASDAAEVTFFDQKVSAKRLAYVVDYSASMGIQGGKRDKLMRDELEKSIRAIGAGVQFQMLFFAGPAWIAGEEVKMDRDKTVATVKGPAGEFKWQTAAIKGGDGKGRGRAGGWKPAGKTMKPTWITASTETIREAVKQIRGTQLVSGTAWIHPLRAALEMDPRPDVIFFMTDGAVGNADQVAEEISATARRGKVVINTISMMLVEGEGQETGSSKAALKDMARRTGGQYTNVNEKGRVEVIPLD
jgi:hypothetical protein